MILLLIFFGIVLALPILFLSAMLFKIIILVVVFSFLLALGIMAIPVVIILFIPFIIYTCVNGKINFKSYVDIDDDDAESSENDSSIYQSENTNSASIRSSAGKIIINGKRARCDKCGNGANKVTSINNKKISRCFDCL